MKQKILKEQNITANESLQDLEENIIKLFDILNITGGGDMS